MGLVRKALEKALVGVSVEGRCSHVVTLPRPLRVVGVGVRCDWCTRLRGSSNVNHGVPQAWWGTEGADTTCLDLAQDLTEVDRATVHKKSATRKNSATHAPQVFQ